MAQGSNMAKIPYTYYSTLYFGTTDMGWGEEGLARVGSPILTLLMNEI